MTDGIFCINKPRGISSTKVVYRVRKWTGVRKSGHAGTLDPAAEGVLLVCQGRATKLVERCMDLPKVYVAQARLDWTSPAFDAEKDTRTVAVPRVPTRAEIEALFAERFRGVIEQVPPDFSAIKINGQSAYKLALKGRATNLKPRPVVIYNIAVERYSFPNLDFRVTCGRGTYIRALIRDLGRELGTGGCLTGLCRVSVGPFHVDTAIGLDSLEDGDASETIVGISEFESSVSRFFCENPGFVTTSAG